MQKLFQVPRDKVPPISDCESLNQNFVRLLGDTLATDRSSYKREGSDRWRHPYPKMLENFLKSKVVEGLLNKMSTGESLSLTDIYQLSKDENFPDYYSIPDEKSIKCIVLMLQALTVLMSEIKIPGFNNWAEKTTEKAFDKKVRMIWRITNDSYNSSKSVRQNFLHELPMVIGYLTRLLDGYFKHRYPNTREKLSVKDIARRIAIVEPLQREYTFEIFNGVYVPPLLPLIEYLGKKLDFLSNPCEYPDPDAPVVDVKNSIDTLPSIRSTDVPTTLHSSAKAKEAIAKKQEAVKKAKDEPELMKKIQKEMIELKKYSVITRLTIIDESKERKKQAKVLYDALNVMFQTLETQNKEDKMMNAEIGKNLITNVFQKHGEQSTTLWTCLNNLKGSMNQLQEFCSAASELRR